MSGRARMLLAALAVVLGAAWPAGAAHAAQWQASPIFLVDPTQVPGTSPDAEKLQYLLLDPQGEPVRPVLTARPWDPVESIEVPPVPGVYQLQAWIEDAEGREVRRASMSLPFDDAAPAPPAPSQPGRWLLGTEAAMLEIGHPEAPLPLSGIRGYAISTDRGGGSSPCAASVCATSETDLDGGVEDDFLSLGTLPEGTTYVRVAAVSGAGVPSPPRTAIFRVDGSPPRLSLQGLPAGWSAGPVELTAVATDEYSGMGAAGPAGPFTAIGVDGGAPSVAPGDEARAWVAGSGVHRVAFYARDAAGNLAGSPGAEGDPPRTAVVRIDEDQPQVTFAAAQDPAEPERIEAAVSDSLSGPSSRFGSIAVRLAGTRARFEPLPTQVVANRLVAHWDSDSYPPGKYEFLATGFDAAGNAGTGSERAHGGRMVLLNPLKTPTSLRAGFLGKGASNQARKVRYGRGVQYGGRLQTAGGPPPAGLEIAVTEVLAPGSRPSRRTTLTRTDADGRFAIRLAPGPPREVSAAFAGNRTLTRAASGSARLAVSAAVRLRASAAAAKVGGAPIIFRGKVAGAGAEALNGLPVELLFRYPGSGWKEFRTVETDARGRFRYAYRFSDDDSRGVRFQFRAYVKGREGWPYEPGASRPVNVTGR